VYIDKYECLINRWGWDQSKIVYTHRCPLLLDKRHSIGNILHKRRHLVIIGHLSAAEDGNYGATLQQQHHQQQQQQFLMQTKDTSFVAVAVVVVVAVFFIIFSDFLSSFLLWTCSRKVNSRHCQLLYWIMENEFFAPHAHHQQQQQQQQQQQLQTGMQWKNQRRRNWQRRWQRNVVMSIVVVVVAVQCTYSLSLASSRLSWQICLTSSCCCYCAFKLAVDVASLACS